MKVILCNMSVTASMLGFNDKINTTKNMQVLYKIEYLCGAAKQVAPPFHHRIFTETIQEYDRINITVSLHDDLHG
jgi:hypothetical protein